MSYGIDPITLQMRNLIYNQNIYSVNPVYNFSEKKQEEKVQLTEEEVLTDLLNKAYDPSLTAMQIVEEYGISYTSAYRVLTKYHEKHNEQAQMKINQHPPEGDTITYIS